MHLDHQDYIRIEIIHIQMQVHSKSLQENFKTFQLDSLNHFIFYPVIYFIQMLYKRKWICLSKTKPNQTSSSREVNIFFKGGNNLFHKTAEE